MAATVAHTLDVARSQLGITEPGDGTQVTKFSEWYASWARSPGYRDTYWCAMYCSWVLAAAGFAVDEAGRYGNCNPWIRWLKAHGRWHASAPRSGDLVFFSWDGDSLAEHIGFVESVRPDGRLVTIEGNATVAGRRDGVWRVVRSTSAVVGYGRPPYAARGAGRVASAAMPGPVRIAAGLGAPAAADARAVVWQSCPRMPRGFGGPENASQRAWAAYWFQLMARWSPGFFRELLGTAPGRAEVNRQEIGDVTIRLADKMLRTVAADRAPRFDGVIPREAWSLYQPGG